MRNRRWCVVLILLLSGAAPANAELYTPSYDRIREGLQRERPLSGFEAKRMPQGDAVRHQNPPARPRDSVWNGLLIGAAAGAGGGYLWARNICGPNDSECLYIAGPVGLLAGAGIGAAVGALVDALHR